MMVARDGVEPPTPAFSALFRLNCFFNQQLNLSRWSIYCDRSVTSADVRLSVGAQESKESKKEKQILSFVEKQPLQRKNRVNR